MAVILGRARAHRADGATYHPAGGPIFDATLGSEGGKRGVAPSARSVDPRVEGMTTRKRGVARDQSAGEEDRADERPGTGDDMSGVAAEPKKPVNKGDTATIKHILDGILVEVRARAIDPVPP